MPEIGSAIIAAIVAGLMNLASTAYFAGRMRQQVVDIDRRVSRIEDWKERKEKS